MAKKTYHTKSDMMSFAQYIFSDDRRGKKQREAKKHFDDGVVCFIPWTVAERIVTEEDFNDWKKLISSDQ